MRQLRGYSLSIIGLSILLFVIYIDWQQAKKSQAKRDFCHDHDGELLVSEKGDYLCVKMSSLIPSNQIIMDTP
jgi:hypothetical protein